MATRSIIAVRGKQGFRTKGDIEVTFSGVDWFGRYCHWDGYPEHMVPTIQAVITRYGVPTAKTLLMNSTWSGIGMDKNGQGINIATADEGEIGLPNGEEGFIFSNDRDKWGTEFAYVIDDDGTITVESL